MLEFIVKKIRTLFITIQSKNLICLLLTNARHSRSKLQLLWPQSPIRLTIYDYYD